MENNAKLSSWGSSVEVMQKSGELHQKLNEVIDEINRKAKSVEETIESLAPHQLDLLLAHNVPDEHTLCLTFPKHSQSQSR